MRKKERLPNLLVSNRRGNVFEIPELEMSAMRIHETILLDCKELIPLPEGSVLMELPGRFPIGFDRNRNRFVTLKEYRGKPVMAASVFLPPAYTQLYRTAYETRPDAPLLPLFAYTPVGWMDGKFWTTAVRVDDDIRHDPAQLDSRRVKQAADRMRKRYPNNRLVEHLVKRCVEQYCCPNAQNFVLERWECPVPVSPSCNSECIGCISKQSGSGIPSTQNRIAFVPTAGEITEYTVPHLEKAERAMISFGQGCEGEPLLQSELIEKAIKLIRSQTSRGTIHMNTNAGNPEALDRLFQAGLDSVRISMNSARAEYYQRYHRPKHYAFQDALKSMKIARKHGAWISLNYFIFPGFTDTLEEMEALIHLVEKYRIDCIQMRNLNIDPDWYIREMQLEPIPKDCIGIMKWMEEVRNRASWIRFGYYNPPKEIWKR